MFRCSNLVGSMSHAMSHESCLGVSCQRTQRHDSLNWIELLIFRCSRECIGERVGQLRWLCYPNANRSLVCRRRYLECRYIDRMQVEVSRLLNDWEIQVDFISRHTDEASPQKFPYVSTLRCWLGRIGEMAVLLISMKLIF